MQPQQPPSFPARPAGRVSQACSERLGLMMKAADEVAIEVDLGGSAAAERIAAGLLAELRSTVPDVARECARGQTLIRSALADMAEQMEAAAARRGYWPLYGVGRSPLPHETHLRALIARLRLVARN
jgi:hypothetical protein